MVERTRHRAATQGLEERLTAAHVGIQQLDRLEGSFDGMYSNFGPLNCAPDLPAVAAECARLLRADGCLVFSVIGRICRGRSAITPCVGASNARRCEPPRGQLRWA